ncbi:4Fe-4S dicluster domain-containing protein [Thermochromatium tepidum]|uniref:4Fe-4S ferredoxin-type domain-containing protein n=1 Tax=Thermochromatium tepidum ATCC 43061 TaxID=316276 RepID=A0A6I6DZU7_THETI|nr:4Fe-4S binding protein [Thermochromatium tepidum]QGU32215.1 hypothetical protein E6P07_03955 [Thermochromatium tepidum ATCC 43061]
MLNPASTPSTQGAALALLEGRELLEEETLCLNLRGRGEHCHRCAAACHADALFLSLDALEVDRARCTGCGGCVPVCPAGALRLSGFSPARFLAALDGAPEVHLHCGASRDDGGGVVIPCFKVLDERLLAAARADGVETLHLHGLEQCTRCRHGGALEWLDRVGRRLTRRLGESAPRLHQSPPGGSAAAGPRARQDQPQLSRRAFLRLAGARASLEAARWLVPVEEDDEAGTDLPFFQGDITEIRRPHPYQMLLAARVEQLPWGAEQPLPWRLRTLEAHCTGCLVCGQRCPTGALLAHEEGHSALAISFEPALCTDCGLCTALCPVEAIAIQPVHRASQVTAPRETLMMRRLRACARCGDGFEPETPDAKHCPICAKERALDEEWLAMLGA